MARQSSSSVSAPPRAGPIAAAKTAAAVQTRRAGRPGSRSSKVAGSRAAAPIAWTALRASSTPTDAASPHAREAAANSTSPAMAVACAPARRRSASPAGSASARV